MGWSCGSSTFLSGWYLPLPSNRAPVVHSHLLHMSENPSPPVWIAVGACFPSPAHRELGTLQGLSMECLGASFCSNEAGVTLPTAENLA